MHKLRVFILAFCFMLLLGCTPPQQPESLSHDVSMKDGISVIPEGVFRFSEQENVEDSFESYLYMRGTSSVNSRILIYRYSDYLVFAAAYQSGSESVMETYYLTRSQGENFLNLVSNYKELKKAESSIKQMGGEEVDSLLTLSGDEKNILPLDLSTLNLELIDKNILFESNVTNEYTVTNTNDYIKVSRISRRDALLGCVIDQMKQYNLYPVASLTVDHIGEIDSIMIATLADGTETRLLVTNDGCLVAFAESETQDNSDSYNGGE